MAKLPIVKIGNPVLRSQAHELTPQAVTDPRFKKLLKDMVSTMHHMDGVGLAANQIGLGIRAVVLECKSNPRYPKAQGFPLEIWINPKIVEYSKDKQEDWEGCLSIPGYRGIVLRSRWVIFEALDSKGRKVRKKVTGFHARVIQHEVDHINGCFYIDRMEDLKRWLHLDEFNLAAGVKVLDRKR